MTGKLSSNCHQVGCPPGGDHLTKAIQCPPTWRGPEWQSTALHCCPGKAVIAAGETSRVAIFCCPDVGTLLTTTREYWPSATIGLALYITCRQALPQPPTPAVGHRAWQGSCVRCALAPWTRLSRSTGTTWSGRGR